MVMIIGDAIVTQNADGIITNITYDPPDADAFRISKELLEEFIYLKNLERKVRLYILGCGPLAEYYKE